MDTVTLATSEQVTAAFAASADFGDLAKKGNFTVVTDENKEGTVKITYTYKDYGTVSAKITIDTNSVAK